MLRTRRFRTGICEEELRHARKTRSDNGPGGGSRAVDCRLGAKRLLSASSAPDARRIPRRRPAAWRFLEMPIDPKISMVVRWLVRPGICFLRKRRHLLLISLSKHGGPSTSIPSPDLGKKTGARDKPVEEARQDCSRPREHQNSRSGEPTGHRAPGLRQTRISRSERRIGLHRI